MNEPLVTPAVALSDMDDAAVYSHIKSLQCSIGWLKRRMEQPAYWSLPVAERTEIGEINRLRKEIEEAKVCLRSRGVVYTPSRAELLCTRFNERIPEMFSLCLTLGNHIPVTVFMKEEPLRVQGAINKIQCTREQFCERLATLYLGEWHKYYYSHSYNRMQWELDIRYENIKKPLRFAGSDIFPYNFSMLCDLIGIRFDPRKPF